jgi:hypothetical protein
LKIKKFIYLNRETSNKEAKEKDEDGKDSTKNNVKSKKA